jgi:HSP20 family protein
MGPNNELSTERRKVATSPITADDKFLTELNEVFGKIERRAFDLFLNRNGEHGKDVDDWLNAQNEFFRFVPCEVADKGNELMIRAEVPGFNQRELQVKVDSDRVFITGHKERTVQSSSIDRIFSDREYKDLLREVSLPVRVEPHEVSTMLHEGVLTVFLRKTGHTKKSVAKGQAA